MFKLILLNDDTINKLLEDFGEKLMEDGNISLNTLIEYGGKILYESCTENSIPKDLLSKEGVVIYDKEKGCFYN